MSDDPLPARSRLEAFLGSAALLDALPSDQLALFSDQLALPSDQLALPSDQPAPSGFKGDEDAWAWRVAVLRFASLMAIYTGQNDQFRAMLNSTESADLFEFHLAAYESALRSWAFDDVPQRICDWAHDEAAATHPVFNRRRRFEYILNRKHFVEWWQVSSRLKPTKSVVAENAQRLMDHLPFLSATVGEINDTDLFQTMIKVLSKGGTRVNAITAAHLLRCHWLSWGLWELSHTERMAVVNRRSGLPPFDESTLREAEKGLNFPHKTGQ
jgi:hypothetical protein